MTEWEERNKIRAKEIRNAKLMFAGGFIGLTLFVGVFSWQLMMFLFFMEMILYGLIKLDNAGALNL